MNKSSTFTKKSNPVIYNLHTYWDSVIKNLCFTNFLVILYLCLFYKVDMLVFQLINYWY